jgi:AcrR family transcriptional regulator
LQRRALQVDETRQRITEAAMRLHTSVGPSEASLSAIAAEAGVTRVTLYRHFSSPDALFRACMEHWTATHPPPNPGPWLAIGDFPTRVRRTLSDIYTWYDTNGGDLYPIYRDTKFAPASNLAAARAINERIADALLSDMATPMRDVKLLRAALVHVVGFWTWRLLTADTGLSSSEAAELASRFVLGVAPKEGT